MRKISFFFLFQFNFLLNEDSDEDFHKYLHENIAEYLLGTWANGNCKPLSYELKIVPDQTDADPNKLTFDKPFVKLHNLSLDRLVPAQPIKYKDFHTHIKPRYNLRKLSALPHHLLNAKMISGLLNE